MVMVVKEGRGWLGKGWEWWWVKYGMRKGRGEGRGKGGEFGIKIGSEVKRVI